MENPTWLIDEITWSSADQSKDPGPVGCTQAQPASSLIEVTPIAFICCSCWICVLAGSLTRFGSENP
jgi:hypothetical protein